MSPRVFATGTTGYVGGDILYALLQAHPSWESSITCLVRSPSRGAELSSAYPNVKVVYGTLDDSQILEEEASKADIVLHWASSDHVGAASAIKRGLERGIGGYWIHTSGTDILLNPEILAGHKDKLENGNQVKVYDDWENVAEVMSFPEEHSHRLCDKIPLSLSTSQKIKAAVVCPPTIWGRGRGTGSTRSHQIYAIAQLTLERGAGILVHPNSTPKTFWPNIHIYDLATLYLNIIESATAELEGRQGTATWGDGGYYFAENGTHYWQDVADWITQEAYKQGYLRTELVSAPGPDEKELLKPAGVALWNLGANCRSIRARELFGWAPKEQELKDEIPKIVKSEAERAGTKKIL